MLIDSFRVCELLYEKRRQFDKILSCYLRDPSRKVRHEVEAQRDLIYWWDTHKLTTIFCQKIHVYMH